MAITIIKKVKIIIQSTVFRNSIFILISSTNLRDY
jgi:hypothetical protein